MSGMNAAMAGRSDAPAGFPSGVRFAGAGGFVRLSGGRRRIDELEAMKGRSDAPAEYPSEMQFATVGCSSRDRFNKQQWLARARRQTDEMEARLNRSKEAAKAREAAEHRAKVARAEAAGIGGWDRR